MRSAGKITATAPKNRTANGLYDISVLTDSAIRQFRF